MKSYPVRIAVMVVLSLALASISFAAPVKVTKDKPKTTTQPTAKDTKTEVSASTQTILDSILDQHSKSSARVIRLTGEQINWQVISSGGGQGFSTNYVLTGTVGQTAVGTGSSTNFGIIHGFQQNFAVADTSCCQLGGDVDHSGGIDVADLGYIVDYLFRSGPPPPCDAEGDVDGSGGIDVADLGYIVDYLFRSGPPPPPCA